MFERFFKVNNNGTTDGKGLGLAIAKNIVDAHKGSLRTDSIEGKGSVFTFTLPLACPLIPLAN